MKTLWFLAAILTTPSLGLAQELDDEENAPPAPEIDRDGVVLRPPHSYRPWIYAPEVRAVCTAVETRTNLVFISAGIGRTFDGACRSALESAGQKCTGRFGATFISQPAGYTACVRDDPYYQTGWKYDCRITCGSDVR